MEGNIVEVDSVTDCQDCERKIPKGHKALKDRGLFYCNQLCLIKYANKIAQTI